MTLSVDLSDEELKKILLGNRDAMPGAWLAVGSVGPYGDAQRTPSIQERALVRRLGALPTGVSDIFLWPAVLETPMFEDACERQRRNT